MNDIKAVIFDVDGTLFSLKTMRVCMLFEILFSLVAGKLSIKDIRNLQKYRREREGIAGLATPHLKTKHFKTAAEKMHVEYSYLVKLVAEWMYKRPLKYLPFIGSHKARKNIQLLRNNGIAVFFYSDYPLFNKMKKLNYDFETSAYWSSLDIEISAFKPNPKFLYHFQTLHGFTKEEILFVGDRLERDKALADNFGCSFLHIGEFKRDCTKNFDAVKNHTQ